jgi:hypothetical protein
MGIVLGFGKTESDFEQSEVEVIESIIRDAFVLSGEGYINDELEKEIKSKVEERSNTIKEKAEEYDKAENPPERYSHYYPSCLFNASDVCVIIKFHHINRKHPFSPDGWALLCGERIAHFSAVDD